MAVAISTILGAHSLLSPRTSRRDPIASYSRPMGTTSSPAASTGAARTGPGASASTISQRSAPSAAAVRCATSSSAAGRSDVDASVWVTASSISARSTSPPDAPTRTPAPAGGLAGGRRPAPAEGGEQADADAAGNERHRQHGANRLVGEPGAAGG